MFTARETEDQETARCSTSKSAVRARNTLCVCMLLAAWLMPALRSQAAGMERLPYETIHAQLKAYWAQMRELEQDTLQLAKELGQLKAFEDKKRELEDIERSIQEGYEALQDDDGVMPRQEKKRLEKELKKRRKESERMARWIEREEARLSPELAQWGELNKQLAQKKAEFENVAYEHDKLIFNQYIAYSFNHPYREENYRGCETLFAHVKSERAKPYFDAYVPLAKKHGEYSQDLKKFLIGAKGVLDKNHWSHIPPSFVTKFKTRLQNETLYGREVYKHKEVWIDLLNDIMDRLMRMADRGFAGSRSEFEAIINQL